MEWETILAFGLLIATLVSFLIEKVSVDTTALTLLGIILIFSGLEISENWPKVTKILSVFSNEAPLTIAAMFVISASLNRCRLIEQTSNYLANFCN